MASSDERAQTLCRSCGLCCDGTLFPRARVAPDDVVHPDLAGGVQWVEEKGTRFLALPCRAFDGTCSLYHETRPGVCGRFKCALLRRCESGETDWDAAAAIVATARTRSDRLKQALEALLGGAVPGQSLSALVARLRTTHGATESPAAFRLRHGQVFVDHVALRAYLTRHFRRPKRKAGPSAPAADVERKR
jgi:hypothetical protein